MSPGWANRCRMRPGAGATTRVCSSRACAAASWATASRSRLPPAAWPRTRAAALSRRLSARSRSSRADSTSSADTPSPTASVCVLSSCRSAPRRDTSACRNSSCAAGRSSSRTCCRRAAAWATTAAASSLASSASRSPARTRSPWSASIRATTPPAWAPNCTRTGTSTRPLATIFWTRGRRSARVTATFGPIFARTPSASTTSRTMPMMTPVRMRFVRLEAVVIMDPLGEIIASARMITGRGCGTPAALDPTASQPM